MITTKVVLVTFFKGDDASKTSSNLLISIQSALWTEKAMLVKWSYLEKSLWNYSCDNQKKKKIWSNPLPWPVVLCLHNFGVYSRPQKRTCIWRIKNRLWSKEHSVKTNRLRSQLYMFYCFSPSDLQNKQCSQVLIYRGKVIFLTNKDQMFCFWETKSDSMEHKILGTCCWFPAFGNFFLQLVET